jgi:hypothetical protein
MTGIVTGEPDKQDYNSDLSRGVLAQILTTATGAAQRAGGGKDYMITFYGSQEIQAQGMISDVRP